MTETNDPNVVKEPDLSKTYTYADYLRWTTEERFELIKGQVFRMSPAPSVIHQRVSANISGELYHFLKNKSCQYFHAPFDVRLPVKSRNNQDIITVVQPDICVICDLSKLDDKGCIGAPDIVVEILSPSNNQKELKNKYEVYEEAGVKEYWIIHPSEKTFLKYTLNTEGVYTSSRLLTLGDAVTTAILPGFILQLDDVFIIDQEK